MTTDIVAQLADSLAKTGVGEKELSYKGQGRKLDDAHSGENYLSIFHAVIISSVLHTYLFINVFVVFIFISMSI